MRMNSNTLPAYSAATFLLVIAAAGCGLHGSNSVGQSWTFDKVRAGSVPSEWTVAETNGEGKPATWQVVEDDAAPSGTQVLALTETRNSGQTYNLLIAEGKQYQDVEIRVVVKADSGKEDQGGGPIWRATDANNYYIARWNPLEDNFRVYFVKDGKRKQLASADVKIDRTAWHEITIRHKANRIEAYLDGKRLIETVDNTFLEAGMVGLWTKADAATAFDTVELTTLK